MYRNWKAICQIENVWLRMLIATAEKTDVLEKLMNGFPELFSEEEGELKVPFSALKVKALESLESPDDCVLMGNVLEPMNIPCVKLGYQGDDELPDRIPPEWIPVVHEIYNPRHGYDILLAENLPDPSPRIVQMNGEDYWIAELCEYDAVSNVVDWITLVPTRFIEFNK